MKVLAALNGLELFGHERGNIEVYKAIRSLGAEVIVALNAHEEGGDVGRHLKALNFATFLLPYSNQWSLMWLRKYPTSIVEKMRSVARSSLEFRRKLSEVQPTHVMLGSPLVYSYLSLALASCRVPMVYRMGDCPPFDSPFNLRIWRAAMRRASTVVAISDFVRREAIAGGAPVDRLTVIHNLAPGQQGQTVKQEPGLEVTGRAGRRIVYVGAIAEHKGVWQLVVAFAILRRRFPDLLLDIVGGSRYDGQYRAEICRLIKENKVGPWVTMHGNQGDPTPFYRNAHVHVAPSVWQEPLGNVVLEAKREGVPSVVYRSGGLPELVRHGIDGVVCEEKTPEVLAAAIASVLENEERRVSMGRAARACFDARFGPERFARMWAEVLLPSIGASSAGGFYSSGDRS